MTVQNKRGFTLVEIMIVVAIIGILSAIAIPAYNGYLRTTRMQKVTDHVETARRWIIEGFISDQTRREMNIPYAGPGLNEFPRTQADLINALNSTGSSSPEGGLPPFADAVDPALGVVGINTANNDAWQRGETITILQPAYLELTAVNITITYGN